MIDNFFIYRTRDLNYIIYSNDDLYLAEYNGFPVSVLTRVTAQTLLWFNSNK